MCYDMLCFFLLFEQSCLISLKEQAPMPKEVLVAFADKRT